MSNQPKDSDRIALLETEIAELRQMVTVLAKKQNWPQYVTGDELAEILQVSARTIQDWVSQDRIPFHKPGGSTRFLLSEIVEWSARHRDKRQLRAV